MWAWGRGKDYEGGRRGRRGRRKEKGEEEMVGQERRKKKPLCAKG